jgi:hypothetical protein
MGSCVCSHRGTPQRPERDRVAQLFRRRDRVRPRGERFAGEQVARTRFQRTRLAHANAPADEIVVQAVAGSSPVAHPDERSPGSARRALSALRLKRLLARAAARRPPASSCGSRSARSLPLRSTAAFLSRGGACGARERQADARHVAPPCCRGPGGSQREVRSALFLPASRLSYGCRRDSQTTAVRSTRFLRFIPLGRLGSGLRSTFPAISYLIEHKRLMGLEPTTFCMASRS